MGAIKKIISKNLKNMSRTRTSMLVVLLGPLLVVMFVGFAFNSKSLYELNVGITGGKGTNIRAEMIESLTNKSYLVEEIVSKEECIEKIKQGILHTCIVVPDNFSIESNNVISFYVDNSRPNLVWKVIGAISEETSIRAEELSYQLSSDLLKVIDEIKAESETGVAKIIVAKKNIDNAIDKLKDIKNSADNINIGEASLDTSSVISKVDNLNKSAKSTLDKISNYVDQILADPNATSSYDTARNINTTMKNYYDDLLVDIENIKSEINNLNSQLDSLNNDIKNVNENAEKISGDASSLITELEEIKEKLDDVKSVYERIIEKIDSIKIKSAEKIASPIQTKINTIAAGESQILYMSPYLLMLLIMLAGLMLSGTIVVMEKNSKAMFRNYTIPISNAKFVLGHYLTSLVIIIGEVVVIGAIIYFFLGNFIIQSLDRLLPLILLTSTLFIFLGIVLGYITNAQEGLTIGALSLGIVFLFISNLVLPLESMSPVVRKIAAYNPYVIASETARKVLLFNAFWKDIVNPLLILVAYTIATIALIVIIDRISSSNLFERMYKRHILLSMGIYIGKRRVSTKKELLHVVKKMKNEEFKKEVIENKELRKYVKKIWKDKELYRILKKGKKVKGKDINKIKERLIYALSQENLNKKK